MGIDIRRVVPLARLVRPWREKTRIVPRDEAREAITQANQGEGGTLLVFGSMTAWNDLLAADLVDELHMMIGAGVLIDGIPSFSVPPPGPMRLTNARQLGRLQHRAAGLLAALTASQDPRQSGPEKAPSTLE